MRAYFFAVAALALGVVSPAVAQGPSFDCGKARQPAEFAICGSPKLSELDRLLVAGYNYIKASEGVASADRIGKPYYFQRLACGAGEVCLAQSMVNEIRDLAAAGAPVELPEWLAAARPAEPAAKPAEPAAKPAEADIAYVPLAASGGKLLAPVTINDAITLKFVIDSGAADVSIPADVVQTLMRTGALSESDFTGDQTYKTPDGSTAPSRTFRIRSLRVGDRVLRDVAGSIAPADASLLLGQSFLKRFQTWSIDNQRQALVLR